MAIINGLYIHVVDEEMTREVETTSHPVESGIPTTDTVKPKAVVISLSGKIVDYGSTKASEVLSKIRAWQKSGSLIEYRGRNAASSMQIQAFDTSHPNTNHGGADFSMELREVRIAKSAYVPQKAAATPQKAEAKKNTETVKKTIKVGDKVVFKGGSVYVSSDAKKAAATKNRSTCKVTKISTASYSVHQYHLISTDGKGVYGWVDLKNIEGAETTSTNGKTNAGTQQVKSSNNSNTKTEYYTVKPGDTVSQIAKKKLTTMEKIMNDNPKAFSRKNDARTLQAGAKLVITTNQMK